MQPHFDRRYTQEQWQIIKNLFDACEQLPEFERAAYLENQPDADPWIRSEVEVLLANIAKCGSFLEGSGKAEAAPDDSHLPEKIGPYTVIEMIGKGGMGVVYAAFDPQLNRRVAIKLLRPENSVAASRTKRLVQEARAASALNHPNIVTIYEIGADAGSDYIVMELIAGATLATRLRDAPPSLLTALRYGVQICDALAAAHAVGIVHRDLKPANVMVTETGNAKLVDFGLAKVNSTGASSAFPSTLEGALAGTTHYMSPEQVEAQNVDARSDIFAFGIVLYEVITGRNPFRGKSDIATLAAILHSEPPPPSTISAALSPEIDAIVARCLRKDRDERYQSILEVKAALEEVGRGAAPLMKPRPARPPRRRLIVGLAVAVLIGMVVVLGYALATRETTTRDTTITQITTGLGLSAYPTLSRDGKLVAFASDRGGRGNLDIWVQQTDGSRPVRLTSDAADDFDPSFSPDGTTIAFRSDRNGGGIYVVPTLGGDARLIAPKGKSPRFSPDGSLIAYWVGEAGSAFLPGSARIYIVPAKGGDSSQFRPDILAAAYPAWAPTGKKLLFLGRTLPGDRSEDVDWYAASIEGPAPTRTNVLSVFAKLGIVPAAGSFWLIPSEWSERSVLFSARSGDTTNIWEAAVDSGGAIPAPTRVTSGTTFEMQPCSAGQSTNRRVAYCSAIRGLGVWSVPATDRPPAATVTRALPDLTLVTSPSVSVDGARLAVALQSTTRYEVAVVDLKTGDYKVIVEAERKYRPRPKISGDGKVVAYWDGSRGYVIDASGGLPQKVCDPCAPPTHVSFDGRAVLFETLAKPYGVLLAEVDSGRTRLVATSHTHPDQPLAAGRFSPDRRSIAFESAVPGRLARRIFVAPFHPDRPAGDDEWVAITDGDATDQEPYWSSDGALLYYLSTRDTFRCIWGQRIDVATRRRRGDPFPVAHFHNATLSLNGVSAYTGDIGLSVSRKSLFFAAVNLNGNIWLNSPAPAQK